ncbi:MAG: 4Fe-4S dicluster domain-containing protein [Slackia sp.]
MTRYAMAIDMSRCIACNTCSVACKIENNLPNNVWWTRVIHVGGGDETQEIPSGTYAEGDLAMGAYTLACQHCSSPACVAVCANGSTFIRDDGIVDFNPEECIGCNLCIEACPYNDVRVAIEEEPQWYTDFAVGDAQAKQHHAKTVEKCTFCAHRVERGELPACVESCPGRARTFGDLDDPNSDISKLIASREYTQLQVEDGTNPSVYILQ